VFLVTATPVVASKPNSIVLTSSWRRNECSPLAGIKFTSCAENVLAQRAAIAAGADEAIFLNTRGHLCEGAFSNVFVVQSGTVLTPPLSSGCLPGVTREVVLELCQKRGIPCREEVLPCPAPDSEPDEVFLTSSIRGIQPISSWDGRCLPAPGGVTGILTAHYAAWLETWC
jgi:branched-chain amino acid aminotransferase